MCKLTIESKWAPKCKLIKVVVNFENFIQSNKKPLI